MRTIFLILLWALIIYPGFGQPDWPDITGMMCWTSRVPLS